MPRSLCLYTHPQLVFDPHVVVLLIAFGTSIGGLLNPLSPPSINITIIVRVIIAYLDHNDGGAAKTVSFDTVVLPEHWNEPCSYTDDCIVFANDEIAMFAPTTVGGFGALTMESVATFTESSDVTTLSSAYDLRCQDDTDACRELSTTAGELAPDGAGMPFGTIQQSTFNNGFCTPTIFGRD